MLLPGWVVKVSFCHSFQWEAIVPMRNNGEERQLLFLFSIVFNLLADIN